ncbi:MAG: hypothetical protein DYG83_04370 [Candidatus Brocadia sp. AMX2]|nr:MULTISPECIES: hypothetical protein [Brocadia]MBC6931712.1 hypothetical protein [Candidatus Brocadia sp.]MBL1169345.1 hypothetical protein [Candidatus Brocadia sp. AMX1]MCK6468861.1 hypothetical protein [Candidatus Brocadia sinica]NOG42198.1 hypothetical protein [Planctomycetota bacterium]KAA0242258.1 MAG: hypothetical protein EDM70_15060 [Candidatus Brocadia sp. AMX2]
MSTKVSSMFIILMFLFIPFGCTYPVKSDLRDLSIIGGELNSRYLEIKQRISVDSKQYIQLKKSYNKARNSYYYCRVLLQDFRKAKGTSPRLRILIKYEYAYKNMMSNIQDLDILMGYVGKDVGEPINDQLIENPLLE